MKKKLIIMPMLVLLMILIYLTGCGQSATTSNDTEHASGGVLVLSVNPEIAVEYDENALVIGISARNDDALDIISNCKGLIGRETREVVTVLVSAIGEAGYFVEEVEGERRQITIEIEDSSQIPHDDFLDEVWTDVRDCINANNWNVSMEVENESSYDITDYDDGSSDYEAPEVIVPPSTNASDYDNGESDYDEGNSDYETPEVVVPPTADTNDYDDGESDYDEGNSDYETPEVVVPPTTDTSDYDDGESDYDEGNSDYEAPEVVVPPSTNVSDYDDGESDYDDGNSDFNDDSDYGSSDYDDDSDYGSSDYDD